MTRVFVTILVFIAGLLLGVITDDWATWQMVKDGVYPGYHCERIVDHEVRQVP